MKIHYTKQTDRQKKLIKTKKLINKVHNSIVVCVSPLSIRKGRISRQKNKINLVLVTHQRCERTAVVIIPILEFFVKVFLRSHPTYFTNSIKSINKQTKSNQNDEKELKKNRKTFN